MSNEELLSASMPGCDGWTLVGGQHFFLHCRLSREQTNKKGGGRTAELLL